MSNEIGSGLDHSGDKYKNLLPWSPKRDSAERAAYNAETCRLEALLRSDLENEYVHSSVPKVIRDRIWNNAWADGHSSGYYGVISHYEELAELVSDAYLQGIKDVKEDLDLDAAWSHFRHGEQP